MVRYKDWSEPAPGTRVRYIAEDPRNRRDGTTGVVVAQTDEVYKTTGRKMAIVQFDKDNVKSRCYVSNLERIEMPYVKNLVGPKPEPVQEPTYPTPWTSDGSNVLDANRKVVARLRYGGFELGSFGIELPMAERYGLAQVIAKAVTEYYKAKAEDSKSPF
jgi:hypothetical protein